MPSDTFERPSSLMKVNEFQHETHYARSYIYRLIEDGRLPVVRVGRSIRIRRVDFETFIDNHLENIDDQV